MIHMSVHDTLNIIIIYIIINIIKYTFCQLQLRAIALRSKIDRTLRDFILFDYHKNYDILLVERKKRRNYYGNGYVSFYGAQ